MASELKSEIKTVEELFMKIRNAPITPKAEVEHMHFIWDWKAFIIPFFSDKMLANHSHYHSFQVRRDGGGQISLRAKKYPQNTKWSPPEGIKLVKDIVSYDPVDVSPFRTEDLNLEKVMSDLRNKYFPLVSEAERKHVELSWDRLCTTLTKMPNRHLPKMKLAEMVKQETDPGSVPQPDYVALHKELDPPALRGERHESQDVEQRVFKQDARVGIDVVLWTLSKSSRPWVGRVHEILSEDEFLIHWFERKTRSSRTFSASSNADGSPYLSTQAMSSVMFWQMSVNPTAVSFDLPEYEYKRIMNEYASHDMCYSG